MGTMTTTMLMVLTTALPRPVPTWLWIIGSAAALLISSGLAGQLLTSGIARLRETAAARREKYSAAVELLVARIEYPYRIRRRTDDEPETIAALAKQGHRLQERLAATRAWVTTENPVVGEVFAHAVVQLNGPFKQACKDAWESPPVTSAAGMNLNGFGIGDQQKTVDALEHAAAYRFGIRRLLPAASLRKRLLKAGRLPR